MTEFAMVETKDPYPFPCHSTIFAIHFYNGTDSAIKQMKQNQIDADEDFNDGFSEVCVTSTRELRALVNRQKLPLVFLCITGKEEKEFLLARQILKMRTVAKYTGKNPNHGNSIFTDIWLVKN